MSLCPASVGTAPQVQRPLFDRCGQSILLRTEAHTHTRCVLTVTCARQVTVLLPVALDTSPALHPGDRCDQRRTPGAHGIQHPWVSARCLRAPLRLRSRPSLPASGERCCHCGDLWGVGAMGAQGLGSCACRVKTRLRPPACCPSLVCSPPGMGAASPHCASFQALQGDEHGQHTPPTPHGHHAAVPANARWSVASWDSRGTFARTCFSHWFLSTSCTAAWGVGGTLGASCPHSSATT